MGRAYNVGPQRYILWDDVALSIISYQTIYASPSGSGIGQLLSNVGRKGIGELESFLKIWSGGKFDDRIDKECRREKNLICIVYCIWKIIGSS
jgi:hypothetical protein